MKCPTFAKPSPLHAILMALSTDIEQIFFKTFDGEICALEFEKWVYNDKTLETVLTPDDYLEFISLSYKASGAKYELYKLIRMQIDLGKYEKWRLLKLLTKALNHDKELPDILMTFYDLYCKGYYFLDNLGLVYGLSVEAPYSHGAETWTDLPDEEKQQLIDSFSPKIEEEIQKVIGWLENGLVVPTGERGEYDKYLFTDFRNEVEKRPTAYQVENLDKKVNQTKWRKFWV